MRYYDFKKHWTRKVEPHLEDPLLLDVLEQDFGLFLRERGRVNGYTPQVFKRGMYPADFESCYWQEGHRGPAPRYWRYVRHSACHWLVNFALRLAVLSEPTKPWRIVTSDQHSTVWDGGDVLFDLQFSALGTPPETAWQLASVGGSVLLPGDFSDPGVMVVPSRGKATPKPK